MIITISGATGTGKTAAARILAKKLGCKVYTMGDLFGKKAQELGMTIDEFNVYNETHPETDLAMDEYQRQLGAREDNFVIDGRMSWYFIPHAVRILLTCDPDETARRVYEVRKNRPQERSDEPAYASVEETRKAVEERTASDVRRYFNHYKLNFLDPSNYDVIIDTTHNPGPETTVEQILAYLRRTAHQKLSSQSS